VSEVPFKRPGNATANRHGQILQCCDGLWSQDDLESHSGQIIARFVKIANRVDCCAGGLTARFSRGASRSHQAPSAASGCYAAEPYGYRIARDENADYSHRRDKGRYGLR
jgi:hypothetical protein